MERAAAPDISEAGLTQPGHITLLVSMGENIHGKSPTKEAHSGFGVQNLFWAP